VVICLERGADDLHNGPADATATHHLMIHLNPQWFTLLVSANPGCPGKSPLNHHHHHILFARIKNII